MAADANSSDIIAALARLEEQLADRRRPNSEVMAAVAKLEDRVDQRFAEVTVELNRRFDTQRFVGLDVWAQYVRATDRRIDDVEADARRTQDKLAANARLILASLVFPVLVALVVAAVLTATGT